MDADKLIGSASVFPRARVASWGTKSITGTARDHKGRKSAKLRPRYTGSKAARGAVRDTAVEIATIYTTGGGSAKGLDG